MHTPRDSYSATTSGSLSLGKVQTRRETKPTGPAIPEHKAAPKLRTDTEAELLSKQMLVSAAYFCILFIASIVPATSQYASRFSSIQHTHFIGDRLVSEAAPHDYGVVISSGMAVVGLRALIVRVSLSIAPYCGIKKAKSAVRFAEQCWWVIYYLVLTSIGFYLLHISEYSWDPAQLWQDYPHIYLDAGVKAYYLFQLGFWITQVYIIHAEERRKDHYQMLLHHFITCMLVVGSYYYHYSRIGHLVMIIMDVVDLQLCFAKLLKYAGFERICDIAFVLFLVGWVCGRHVVYLYHLWFAFTQAPKTIARSCKWHATQNSYVCFSQHAHTLFACLLLLLQVLTLVWLWMIVKVVIRVVKGDGATDTRSDDED